jgi:DNA primase
MNSPLRKDSNPSFSIFMSARTGKLMYKDFSNHESGDVFKFVRNLLGLKYTHETYKIIAKDMKLSERTPGNVVINQNVKQVKPKIISVQRKLFTKKDLEYWNGFGITEQTLKMYNVSAIKAYFVDGQVTNPIKYQELAYCMRVYNHFKIYRPLSDRSVKWRSSCTAFDLQGFEQLPAEGDVLVITKSMKDVMLLHELGLNAVAPQSEVPDIPDTIMNNLKKRFKKIIVFFDNDDAGETAASKLGLKYNLCLFSIKKELKCKDLSDFYAMYGREQTENLVKPLKIAHKTLPF